MPCLLQRLFPKETVSCCLVTPLPPGEGPGVRANGAWIRLPRFCEPLRLKLMTLPKTGTSPPGRGAALHEQFG